MSGPTVTKPSDKQRLLAPNIEAKLSRPTTVSVCRLLRPWNTPIAAPHTAITAAIPAASVCKGNTTTAMI